MTVSTPTLSQLLRLEDGVLPAACPSRIVLDHVTSRWGVLLLVALSEETLRWGELRRRVQGISEKMLAQTLRILEADGFVHREAHPTIPPHVEYSLTDQGREIAVLLIPLMQWIVQHAEEILTINPADQPRAQRITGG
jgi:DNA-binding HxlR family transcriptional regulator